MTEQYVFITGATSGIGEACASLFAQKGYNIIITGRRADRLETLQTSLQKKFSIKCIPLCFDVQNKTAVFDAVNTISSIANKITVLVNNAGLALGRANFDEADMDDWEIMIDTNLKGLLYVSRAIVPYFIKNKNGHIINIGSIAGKEVYAQGNVYCATKHAVDAISKAQRMDLVQHRIKVTAIHPGAVETEFSIVRFKGNQQKANAVYQGYQSLIANDIANIVYYAATLPNHVCINDLVVTCTAQANSTTIYNNN
jgi:NADP-dependent 3-hydroxy acid dehydrogenase YdfG